MTSPGSRVPSRLLDFKQEVDTKLEGDRRGIWRRTDWCDIASQVAELCRRSMILLFVRLKWVSTGTVMEIRRARKRERTSSIRGVSQASRSEDWM